MKKASLLLLFVMLFGCSQSDSGSHARSHDALASQATTPAAFPSNTQSTSARAFADLPDRGDLVDYERSAVRRSGAYTWHAVKLSESHAIGAIVTGQMTVSAPDGAPIVLKYERHIEHRDGNWTWVGETASGEQALITFGSTAAFGSIPQGRGRAPLRLTVRDGRPWLVSVDRAVLDALDMEATDPAKPDYLIPPKLSAGYMVATVAPAMAAMTATAKASGTRVIDLLAGYTDGFAASLGGEAAARTRIQNLVDITNQAYVNSQVDVQLRLVHSMRVNYADATSNGTALEELTGFRAPSTPIEPAPAFAALRAAREEYGADLVTVVRKFQTPENEGCGIAWLIGGGMSDIVPSDEYFGYSVVSDGQDTDSDGTYYCRDETLAHEVGHNMGSQHDVGTAGNEPGRYSYSYGYKAAPSTGNFYTIMAYGDDGQTDYRVFSNPRVTFCGGRACGTADADVARSLGQTAPLIADFRAQVAGSRARIDFDGDGRADIFWRKRGSGANTIWLSADSATPRGVSSVPNLDWFVAGTGDFNGDGATDVLWRDRRTGRNAIWLSGNAATQVAVSTVDNMDWKIVGTGDFDGDGRDGILWRNSRTGTNTIWRSGDSGSSLAVARVSNLNWSVAGVADFSGDGKSDILWRNAATGVNTIWSSGNSSTDVAVTTVGNPAWRVAGVGDFDGDGRADLLWRNANTGANTIWRSADSGLPQAVSTVPSSTWRVVGVDDYDGDGRFDLLWRNAATGANVIWEAGDSGTQSPVTDVPNLDWVVQGSPLG